jgi:3-methyladenine DNA glycosylase AlkD
MNASSISRLLRSLGDENIAQHSQRYFKTGKGGYGEGGRFLGIRVPVLRQHVRQLRDVAAGEAFKLLTSEYHEERLFALLLLIDKFKRGKEADRGWIYKQYLANTRYINNWDLVDSSADKIVGAYLEPRSRKPLYKLARSKSLWERRIAIMATFHFIRQYDFNDALAISKLLMTDQEDPIHKASGWMLREVGKRNMETEKAFLDRHCLAMPRTMLRYAVERFDQADRFAYLQAGRSGRRFNNVS